MEEFKKLLKRNIVRSNQAPVLAASLIVGLWEKALIEVFGLEAKGRTRAVSFRSGILKVNVPSKIWVLGLGVREEDLVSTLNKKLSSTVVKSLKLEVL